MQYIWLFISVILSIVEIFTSTMVSIWFAVAAFVIFLISPFTNNFTLEIIIFIVLSSALMYLTKPLAKKVQVNKGEIESRVLGQEVLIMKKIGEGLYEVKLDGKYWRLKSDKQLEIGSKATVGRIEGNKLIAK